MANQAIALGVRAPQTDILGGAIQRNAQMMNMMAQQRAAERQGALAEQKMQLEQQLAVPQQAKAQSEAQSAKLKYVGDFLDTTALAISKVRNAQEARGVADILLQHFPDMQDAIAQEMSSLPSDPAQFEAWRQRTLYQTMDAKDQLKQHFENITTGDQTYTMATPEYAGGGMPTTEVPGTRVKAPQGITYVRGPNGEIFPMPTKTTGGEAPGLVGGPRGSADVVYGNGKFAQPSKPISQSTIGEVQDFQRNSLIPATRGKVGAGADMGTGAVGTYQITYGTLKNYAPKVLGPNWRNTPFTAEVQDQIARAIYEDNKNGDLSKIWAGLPSNKPGAYSNVPWEQAREKIAQVESGGTGGAGGVQFGQPIEGTDIKLRQAEAKARTAAGSAGVKYDKMIRNAEELLKHPSLNTIVGNIQGNLPETVLEVSSQGAANALNLYRTLLVQGGFAELQALRDASPTGGALGQVSDRENAMLQQAAGALGRSQDEASFKQHLREFIDQLKKSKTRVEQAYAEQFGKPFSAGAAAPSAAPKRLKFNPATGDFE